MHRMIDQRGGAIIELAILTPALVLLILFVVLAGRVAQTRHDVQGAAADAARAASTRQHAHSATAEARRVAEASLGDRSVTCRRLRVGVDAGALRPGGTVSVRVDCRVALSDLSLLGVPGSTSVVSRATEVVDTYRGE